MRTINVNKITNTKFNFDGYDYVAKDQNGEVYLYKSSPELYRANAYLGDCYIPTGSASESRFLSSTYEALGKKTLNKEILNTPYEDAVWKIKRFEKINPNQIKSAAEQVGKCANEWLKDVEYSKRKNNSEPWWANEGKKKVKLRNIKIRKGVN